ncbi:MAG: tRNA(Ile)(2)-agmatinylcytidine synthase [Thaumarchaeota archaeon]|nr:tRNA(Ile)(2)-agmatinylcytidine synthase [Nitrososphaerota archaeon]
MCTTFLCYIAVKQLRKKGERVKFLDYPNLIRLNPNIPWKTRGNASLVLRIRTSNSSDELYHFFKSLILKFATSPKANSGLVILEGEAVPQEIQLFSRRALFSVLGLREARELISGFDLKSFALRSEQGLIGALAGIGNLLASDHTFELIAYRKDLEHPRSLAMSRVLNLESFPGTFSSFDSVHGRVMISPHGPDPVLCGIRGESAQIVKKAFLSLRRVDNLEGFMIFRSNQGTGEHLGQEISLDNLKAYTSGRTSGMVKSSPHSEIGGHVFFDLENGDGEIACACYEPTAEFRNNALKLMPGDLIEVGGGVRKATSKHPQILNLEFFRPLNLIQKINTANPNCPHCESRMRSRGRGQGFRCEKCHFELKNASKIEIFEKRDLDLRLYLPPVKAHRHLTKPLQRCSMEKANCALPVKQIRNWVS